MALNEISPARAIAAAGRKRVRIDWKRGAALLIDGETPTAICAALGIDEDRLWRHLRSSLRFQFLLRQARERRQLLGQIRLEAASREAAVRLARCAEKPEAGLIAELAANGTGRGTGGGTAAPPDDEGHDVIARLAQSGRRPPNQALRQRCDREWRQMSAEVDETRRLLAGQAARLEAAAQQKALQQARQRSRPVAAAPVQAAATSAQTENKTHISTNKPELSTNKAVPAAAPPAPAVPRRPDRSSMAPLALHTGQAIVDLTDIHGNPLGGAAAAQIPDRDGGAV